MILKNKKGERYKIYSSLYSLVWRNYWELEQVRDIYWEMKQLMSHQHCHKNYSELVKAAKVPLLHLAVTTKVLVFFFCGIFCPYSFFCSYLCWQEGELQDTALHWYKILFCQTFIMQIV